MKNLKKIEQIKFLIDNPPKNKKVFEFKDNKFFELVKDKGFIPTRNTPQARDTVICINNPDIQLNRNVLVWHEQKTY